MVETSRYLRHTQPGLSHDASAQKDRRNAIHDRRGRFIQVQWERRAGIERRTRNLQEELKRYQHWRTASTMTIWKYKLAIQNRALAPSTIQRYTRYIFQCIGNIQKYDKEMQRIKRQAA